MEDMIKILRDKGYDVNIYNGLKLKRDYIPKNLLEIYEERIKTAGSTAEKRDLRGRMKLLKETIQNEGLLKKTYCIDVKIPKYIFNEERAVVIIINQSEDRIVYEYSPNIIKGKSYILGKEQIIEELKKLPNI